MPCRLPALPLLTLLVALAAPASSHARTVVLRGTAGTAPGPDSAELAASARALLGAETFEMGGQLSDVLGLDHAPAWVLGAGQQNCADEPVSTVVLDQVVARASDAIDGLEFAAARALLDTAQRSLPCLDGVVNPATLYQVWFLLGLSAFHEGDEDRARAAFGVATSLDPTRAWSPDYAPAPQGVFLAALQDSLANETRALGRDEGQLGDVFVDGAPVNGSATLRAGIHLVQIREGERWRGILLDLPAGDGWLSLLSPAAVEARVMRADPAVAPFVADRLAASGWAHVLLGSELGVAEFDVPNQRFGGPPSWPPPPSQGVTVATSTLRRPASPGTTAGVVMAGVGASVGVAGFVLSGLSYQRGLAVLDEGGGEQDYAAAYRDNLGGLGMGIAGAVAAGTGIIIAALSARNRDRGPSLAAQRRRAQQQRGWRASTP